MSESVGLRRLPDDWFDAPVPANVRLGQGSWLYSTFAFLHYRSRLPDAVTIGEHSGVYIGTSFELGPTGSVHVGQYCTLVGAIIRTDRRVSIGDYTFISHEVVIADDPFAVPPTDRSREAGPDVRGARLGEGVWIGAGAVIIGPVVIGDRTVVGAKAVVTEDVPPDAVVAGNPARVVRRTAPG